MMGLEIRNIVNRIGHEIKENTELAEHEMDINKVKSTFTKIRKVL